MLWFSTLTKLIFGCNFLHSANKNFIPMNMFPEQRNLKIFDQVLSFAEITNALSAFEHSKRGEILGTQKIMQVRKIAPPCWKLKILEIKHRIANGRQHLIYWQELPTACNSPDELPNKHAWRDLIIHAHLGTVPPQPSLDELSQNLLLQRLKFFINNIVSENLPKAKPSTYHAS